MALALLAGGLRDAKLHNPSALRGDALTTSQMDFFVSSYQPVPLSACGPRDDSQGDGRVGLAHPGRAEHDGVVTNGGRSSQIIGSGSPPPSACVPPIGLSSGRCTEAVVQGTSQTLVLGPLTTGGDNMRPPHPAEGRGRNVHG